MSGARVHNLGHLKKYNKVLGKVSPAVFSSNYLSESMIIWTIVLLWMARIHNLTPEPKVSAPGCYWRSKSWTPLKSDSYGDI